LELGLVEEHAEQAVVGRLAFDEDVGELLVEGVAEVLLAVALGALDEVGVGGGGFNLLVEPDLVGFREFSAEAAVE
jgi:hypothetical protein